MSGNRELTRLGKNIARPWFFGPDSGISPWVQPQAEGLTHCGSCAEFGSAPSPTRLNACYMEPRDTWLTSGADSMPPPIPRIFLDTSVRSFDVFAAVTSGNKVTPLVDGERAMRAMWEAVADSKQFIFVTDWWMNTSIAMVRDPHPKNESRVGNALIKAAVDRGVDVRVILYHSTSVTPLQEEEAIFDLRNRSSLKIKCFAHRPGIKWTNHQKSMVVDGKIAFVGGVDLTTGRWDTSAHPVIDLNGAYEGDYYNSTLPLADPNSNPRLPWHDVHCMIEGPATFDVARNFAERWNNTKDSYDFVSRTYDRITLDPKLRSRGGGSKYVQIVRSLSPSSGTSHGQTEHSVLSVYLRGIQLAEKFIYIENQYFISNFGTGPVQNPIMSALAQRIERAIIARKELVVILVVPVIPEGGVLSSWMQQEQMHWQFLTINRDQSPRHKRLRGVVPLWQRVTAAARRVGASPAGYLSIHNLRGWAKRNSTLFTEQVYVHAKTMIIDDRWAIIGSANVNDRSMLGDRDSEIVAVIQDAQGVDMMMNGKRYRKANKFAHELRVNLWKEHLGTMTPTESKAIEDPIATFRFWKERSSKNSRAFLKAFPFLPRDAERKLPDESTQNRRTVASTAFAESVLATVKGQLVDRPFDWLLEEDLETFGIPDDTTS